MDSYFQATLQGYVNEFIRRLRGGVSGHAGVFSNAMDVAKIMELYKKEITAINSIFLKKLLMILICYLCSRKGEDLVLINHNWVLKVLHVVVLR
jgi:hypothetical protein